MNKFKYLFLAFILTIIIILLTNNKLADQTSQQPPNVIGLELSPAKKILKKNGFTYQVKHKFLPDSPNEWGKIIAQTRKEKTIILWIGSKMPVYDSGTALVPIENEEKTRGD